MKRKISRLLAVASGLLGTPLPSGALALEVGERIPAQLQLADLVTGEPATISSRLGRRTLLIVFASW